MRITHFDEPVFSETMSAETPAEEILSSVVRYLEARVNNLSTPGTYEHDDMINQIRCARVQNKHGFRITFDFPFTIEVRR